MTEFIERMSLDDLDFGDEHRPGEDTPFTPAKLIYTLPWAAKIRLVYVME